MLRSRSWSVRDGIAFMSLSGIVLTIVGLFLDWAILDIIQGKNPFDRLVCPGKLAATHLMA